MSKYLDREVLLRALEKVPDRLKIYVGPFLETMNGRKIIPYEELTIEYNEIVNFLKFQNMAKTEIYDKTIGPGISIDAPCVVLDIKENMPFCDNEITYDDGRGKIEDILIMEDGKIIKEEYDLSLDEDLT